MGVHRTFRWAGEIELTATPGLLNAPPQARNSASAEALYEISLTHELIRE